MMFLERFKLIKHERLEQMGNELFVTSRYNIDHLESVMGDLQTIKHLDQALDLKIQGVETEESVMLIEKEKVTPEGEITYKETRSANQELSCLMKSIFEDDCSESLLRSIELFMMTPHYQTNSFDSILCYQDESIEKVARRMNLIEFMIFYALTSLNSSIKKIQDPGFNGDKLVDKMTLEINKLKKYTKYLIFFLEFSNDNKSKDLSLIFRSPTANKSCMHCCLLVVFSSLNHYYSKLSFSKLKMRYAELVKSAIQDITEFVGVCLAIQLKIKPELFKDPEQVKKTKRRIGGFFGSKDALSASCLKEFAQSYLEVNVAIEESSNSNRNTHLKNKDKENESSTIGIGPGTGTMSSASRRPKAFSFGVGPSQKAKKRALKFNLEIQTNIPRECRKVLFSKNRLQKILQGLSEGGTFWKLSSAELDGMLNKTWLNDPKSKRIMDKFKFNLVEVCREYKKFIVQSLKKVKEEIQKQTEPRHKNHNKEWEKRVNKIRVSPEVIKDSPQQSSRHTRIQRYRPQRVLDSDHSSEIRVDR